MRSKMVKMAMPDNAVTPGPRAADRVRAESSTLDRAPMAEAGWVQSLDELVAQALASSIRPGPNVRGGGVNDLMGTSGSIERGSSCPLSQPSSSIGSQS